MSQNLLTKKLRTVLYAFDFITYENTNSRFILSIFTYLSLKIIHWIPTVYMISSSERRLCEKFISEGRTDACFFHEFFKNFLDENNSVKQYHQIF